MRTDQIGLVVGGTGFVLLLTMVIVTMIVPSAGRRLRRYNEQRAALKDFFASAPGRSLGLDWAAYGEVPKQEVILVARKASWQFTGDELTDTGWTLRFTKSQ
ncbi:hypothetical protein KIPE111705_14610 [Kibdelosporangium persicum]|uniref:Type II secretion system protein n=1 Tax=Kibdelosporangium persicum TaxID=2698649 RepID=A0ABX2FBI0_9PSEU|nr:hypothetical protein [Kibdelosporangium persicum]NRN68237.1 hypothetical protein [Kibdelosporangium persicum]